MKRFLIVLATLALAGAACGTTDTGMDPATGSDTADHNDADIAFLQGMIPHHQQAITMSELATENTDNDEVLDLADRISSAQGPEIQQMESLLETWGVESEGGMGGDMEGMGGGGHEGHGGGGGGGHPGMLTDGQLDELAADEGEEFDRLFLTGMIEHHEGAITSSEKVLEEGASDEVKQLARDIIEVQEVEIAEMEELLTTL